LRPCFMPQRPWDSPFRAFPSRRAVPPSGGLLLPCGFDVDPRPARRLRFVASAFRRAPPGEPRGGSVRAHGATGGWDRASCGRRDRPSPHELPRTARGTADRSHRARRPVGRAARFEALLPSRVRSRDGRNEVQACARAPRPARRAVALLGFSPFWSLPHHNLGSVSPQGDPANRAPPTKRAPFRTSKREP
jgi:hypothetical protein